MGLQREPLVTNHVWLEAVLEELKGSLVQNPVLQGQFMRQMLFSQLHFRLLQQITVFTPLSTLQRPLLLPPTLVPSSKAIFSGH